MSTETTTIPLDRPFTATTVEEVEELLQQVAVVVVRADWTPTTMWCDEAGDWHGIRPVDEDDGQWADLPPESRQTLAVPALPFDPDDSESIERALPVYVLWHDAMLMPAPVATDQTRPTADQSGSRAPVQEVTAAIERMIQALRKHARATLPSGYCICGAVEWTNEHEALAAAEALLSDVDDLGGLRDVVGSALIGGPDIPDAVMHRRPNESYLDWSCRVADVAVDAVVAHLLAARSTTSYTEALAAELERRRRIRDEARAY